MKSSSILLITLCGLLVSLPCLAEEAAAPTPRVAVTADGEGDAESTPESAASLPTDTAGFVEAMAEQITAIGQTPVCDEVTGRCRYSYQRTDAPAQEIQLWYSASSNTVYIFANRLAEATIDNNATPVLVRHLAAVNWVLRLARFEWNSADGEVRLSTVQNVDTSFDRRALRGLLRFVQGAVDRYQPEIAQILSDHESAPELPSPAQAGEVTVSDRHGYMAAIEEELRALGVTPTCDAEHGRCTYEFDSETASNVFGVTVSYNHRDNTVTVAIDRYLSAPTQNPRTGAILQRLLELNWQLLVPAYQWNASSNQIRLHGIMNTDSNFDRRAFRGVIQAVHATGEQNYRALRAMLNP